ncbi:BTAD domain-containing putative transcriptional regulator, partial [Streptomyces avidinii]
MRRPPRPRRPAARPLLPGARTRTRTFRTGRVCRPPLAAALLTTLLLRHGRRGSTQALIDAVWGDAAPAAAAGALRGHVAGLRRVIEPGRAPRTPARVLVSRPNGYALHLLPDALVLTVFDRRAGSAARAVLAGRPGEALALYDSALALWDGVPLAGVPGPFAAAQRGALVEQRLAALEARWEVALLLGGHARAVEELRVLARPLLQRVRLQELLMSALYETDVRPRPWRFTRGPVRPCAVRRFGRSGGWDPGAELDRIRRLILAGPDAGTGVRTGTGTGTGEDGRPGPVSGPANAGPPPPVPDNTRPRQSRSRGGRPAAPVPAPAAAAAPVSVPAPTALVSPTLSLPPDTADLVGRDAEIARLRQALENGPVAALGAISGMGGVGKTAVAVRVAHEVAASFPDGVFFADLRGMDARPADPHQVLGDLLRALGVTPAQLPAETAERVALHRSLLADRRVLLVLDNARDLRQVRDLLPTAPGCGLLVTSRTWLTGLGGLGGATLVH